MSALALLALLQAAVPAPAAPAAARAVLVDGFDTPSDWSAHPADGVSLTLAADSGHTGQALRLDFAFTGGGYAIARRAVSLDLSVNYAFTFWIKGESAPNTLEFKLIDASGENVWWYTERDRAFDGGWHQVTVRKRQVGFAWGPKGGGDIDHVAAIEFVVTAGKGGGKGRVWLDDFYLTPKPVAGPYTLTPRITATSATPGHPATKLLDRDTATTWQSAGPSSSVTIDFLRPREFGGLSLVWEPGRKPKEYAAQVSDDGRQWREVSRALAGTGGYDYVFLPDAESRYVRLDFSGAAGLREVRVEPLEWSASRNAFFTAVAKDAPRGIYPRYFRNERADWTVVGVDGAVDEALISEDGAVEAGTGGFTVEPFLVSGSKLYTWSDVEHSVSLEQSRLPIPSVEWRAEPFRLTETAFAVGNDSGSSVVMRYRIRNTGSKALVGTFATVIRPFQVNPPWQFLGAPGGASRIDSLRWDGTRVLVNADQAVIPIGGGATFHAAPFAGGDVVGYLRQGVLPITGSAHDPFGAASGAIAWTISIQPGDSIAIGIEVPLGHGRSARVAQQGMRGIGQSLAATAAGWTRTLDRAGITLPAAGRDLTRTIASTIGYILVNRDGPALQPGSRSYERSWIRDGALTSAALLRFGHADVVKDFILWYAGFQYPDGKIPCCVDRRGADPVAEHDSHGEFIYLVMEYFRHTGDRALLEQMWPRVVSAAGYIDSLRQTQRTAQFQTPDQRAFYGLLPPSISHEGYSAKPMHSYWDDFFALRGLKDAVAMAATLGKGDEAKRLTSIREQFSDDLYNSITEAMKQHHIDFIPGSADLGDFDATSTTIAVSPGGELERLPEKELLRTFEKYWTGVQERQDSSKWESYTPYELRTVGTVLRLGWKDRALELLDGFMKDREPREWNQWPEVVWRQPRAPKFLGDLPHTWVGSDFLRSASDLFVYERESDSALVIAAGIPDAWLTEAGVSVNGLSTWWGPLSYTAAVQGTAVTVSILGGLRVPPGGILVHPPGSAPVTRVRVDGKSAKPAADGSVVVRSLPSVISFER